jgi:dTDP-glucose pyrophosphorylase
MNVLVLMAGGSSGFHEAGYPFPKSLIEVDGKPIVRHVIEHLAPLLDATNHLTVMVRRDENAKYYIGAVVNLLCPAASVLEVQGETSGAACTALLAVDLIDNQDPLVIINGDQLIRADLKEAIGDFQRRGLDGGIVVFDDIHPRWSFVKCGEDGLVIEAAEKRPISRNATAGFYYFKSGSDFVLAAQSMILKGASVGGLFYVCPAYNELILRNRRIGVHRIDKRQYVSLATPQNVQAFEREFAEVRQRQP